MANSLSDVFVLLSVSVFLFFLLPVGNLNLLSKKVKLISPLKELYVEV